VARHTVVERDDPFADRRVELGEREEPPVAQPRIVPKARLRHDDPALRHLDGDLDLGVRHRSRTGGDSTAHSRGLYGRAGTTAVS
jgi:hypothetical protein